LNEVLFTPWRLAYLVGTDSPRTDGCVFCGLPSRSDEDALIVHRSAHAYVVMNRFPYTNGHLMVIPFAHRASLAEMTAEERSELIELGAACEAALRAEYQPHGMNLGLNLGRSAGAGIADHAHLHVVPRWDGDTNFLTVTAGTRTVPEVLSVTRSRLAARFGAR
jgi:ATP adenylyltransferase